MAMDWINKNAKYMVIGFGIFIAGGMLFMGPFDFTQTQNTTYVGKVNGQVIPLESFRDQLNTLQEQRRQQTGRTPEGIELVQLRQDLFNERVRGLLMQEVRQTLGLHASPLEMWDHLENNPFPGLAQDTNFQTDGAFDKQKYLAWIHDPRTLDYPFMREYENNMKASIIPDAQLQQLLRTQVYPTTLEKAHQEQLKKTKAKLVYYVASLDSFAVEDSLGDDELRAFYESRPDTFYQAEEAAVLGFIRVAISPSKNDSTEYLELTQDLRRRALADSNFEELAISFSDDAGSAENGGSLGGFQTGDAWVPEFTAAAETLEVGEISQPVLTQFGYHLIRCNAVDTGDSVPKWDLSHILIKIESTPETVDSAMAELEKIREQVKEEGLSLRQAAEQLNYTYETTGTFYKNNFAPFGSYQYVPGMHSFAFSNTEEDAVVSEVLQNDNAIFLFDKKTLYPPGRSFERDKEKVRELLLEKKKMAKAVAHLEGLRDQAEAMPDTLGVAVKDTTGMIAVGSWIRGIGYNSRAAREIFAQPVGEWGPVVESDFGAVLAKVLDKQEASMEALIQTASQSPLQDPPGAAQNLYQRFMDDLRAQYQVENNLDLIYRN